MRIFTNCPKNGEVTGVIALSDQFSYNSNLVGHYALGWYHDSWNTGGPSAYLSSYGGIKFFAGGQPRVYLSSNGNFGIGTINGASKLSILRDFAGEDKTSVAELQMNVLS
ncbi:hypothetical protein BDE36_2630 [Arcticibacter tournemirensis]|uniref:Uncharacterized protein n=1 Tax=Arcticibacter tournemirensis TaxID=699437 RepID=A0A5M9GTT5_9SPHI|nr:hypothetical protein [Arcticibacter tournemirensis]KAA8476168.1 hypothetical protein F1649_20480 [Arcticibacter tournemirensis]TQM50865.1 hypothetical protein BDE36_2630 [Arcticibacter tournemirensis]